jgi:hypothetical protein
VYYNPAADGENAKTSIAQTVESLPSYVTRLIDVHNSMLTAGTPAPPVAGSKSCACLTLNCCC